MHLRAIFYYKKSTLSTIFRTFVLIYSYYVSVHAYQCDRQRLQPIQNLLHASTALLIFLATATWTWVIRIYLGCSTALWSILC